jgi:cell division septum initiation protein DivIVA
MGSLLLHPHHPAGGSGLGAGGSGRAGRSSPERGRRRAHAPGRTSGRTSCGLSWDGWLRWPALGGLGALLWRCRDRAQQALAAQARAEQALAQLRAQTEADLSRWQQELAELRQGSESRESEWADQVAAARAHHEALAPTLEAWRAAIRSACAQARP